MVNNSILFSASEIFCFEFANDNLIYPLPSSPKDSPAKVATPFSFNSLSANSLLLIPVLVISGLILAGVIFVITNTEWNVNSADVTSEQMTATFVETSVLGNIAELLIRNYVLAFEAVSVVLLGAVIGALALVRRR